MGRRKRILDSTTRNFIDSATKNNITFQYYYNRLTELAISMFEWKNLPESVDPRFLELTLFSDGMCIFFRDEVMGELALQTMIGGNLSVYRIPKIRRAYATNGYNKKLDENDSVIIFNNMIHTNSIRDIEMFAQRLYNIDRTIDVNINAQKTPILITCNENERLTMKNIYKEFDGNSPVIYANKGFDPKSVNVLKTDAPLVADKLYQLKTQIWNEALTYLGISNINVQKKERLLQDEVTRNLGGTIASRYPRLEARKQACQQINKMFELNIDVDYRDDLDIDAISQIDLGGVDNE